MSLKKIENKGLIWRKSLNSAKLGQFYPPKFMNTHKNWIYSQISLEKNPPKGYISIARWQALQIPFPEDIIPPASEDIEIKIESGFFKYERKTGELDEHEKVWYLNFADRNLFGFYQGPLFAQDEMQVMEHPILGSIRAWLGEKSLTEPKFHPNTQDSNGSPTPYLIMGAERRIAISTDPDIEQGRPNGLYGKNFINSSIEAVKNATKILNPPTISNILAISAITLQHGKYSKFQINKLFSTLYTGFIAARVESQNLSGKNHENQSKITIHTGNWGCGAFGGNSTLIAIIQCIAAHCAGIDTLIYHPVSYINQFSEALKIYRTKYIPIITSKGPMKALADLETLGFEWGVSDGN